MRKFLQPPSIAFAQLCQHNPECFRRTGCHVGGVISKEKDKNLGGVTSPHQIDLTPASDQGSYWQYQMRTLKGCMQGTARAEAELTEVAWAHSLGIQRCCRKALQRSRLRSRLLRQVLVLSCIIVTPLIATCRERGWIQN